jgi:hypothetical protein
MSATRSKSDLKLSIEASKHAQTITGGIERVCEKLGVAEGEALDLGGRHGQRRPEHRDGRRDGQAPVAAPRRRRPTPRGSSPATRRCAASRTRRTHEISPLHRLASDYAAALSAHRDVADALKQSIADLIESNAMKMIL